ncbi:MAG: hypothetical protein JSU87_09885 [Gemmatimonadota bacterium]|nr:MAG: hypothetical protein JSU87_09885 [Gemmatimonadota bacterium]
MATWLAMFTIQLLVMCVAAPEHTTRQDRLPTLDEVLERYVEAVGGREALERLTTRAIVGRLVTDLPTWEPPVHESDALRILGKVPGKYLLMWESARGASREGLDGETCWKLDGAEVELDARYDPGYAWIADPQNALRMRDYFPEMRVVDTRTLGGRPVHRVDIDDHESHALYFDAETGLLARLGIFTELGDYREVDGVLVPFRMAISRKGGSSTFIFDKIEHNVAIDDAEFAPSVR